MNVPYKIIDRRGNETKPNQGQNSNYNIEPNVWTTITARTDGKKTESDVYGCRWKSIDRY